MMANEKLADFRQRQVALDPERSFIVQAPAGSGKTGLLTQRYLKLLTRVNNPEEIIAITFTRKAAAEMRSRVLGALADSSRNQPEDDFEHQTWQLAKDALTYSHAMGWDLLENPQRLRIRTIDSLCQYIARQMPILSGFGAVPDIDDAPAHLYLEAASSVLLELEAGTATADALEILLVQLDNNIGALQGLIAGMLAQRDKWLRHIVSPDSRKKIEAVLRGVVETHLGHLQQLFPQDLANQLPGLARFAAANLAADHPIAVCNDMHSMPMSSAKDFRAWKALASILLTNTGTWRKAVTVQQGFPAEKSPEDKEMKLQMLSLLDRLQNSDVRLAEYLHGLRGLPEPIYTDQEWTVIAALFTVLRMATAHLRVVFSKHGSVDYSEPALAAQQALGSEMEPTELALRLDYQIRHLLVDEFQDTSQNQHKLFSLLTAGWVPGDGRTLFLVGDPMQSIYGFREAEVGLFLDAWQGSLGGVVLEPIRLAVNFRSDKGIIDWLNQHFPKILPGTDDKVLGAVSYAPSTAFRAAGDDAAVTVYPVIGQDDSAEADQIVEIIQHARTTEPAATVAILVRNKSHLKHIVDELRLHGLRYQAVEIGELRYRPVVMDLMSLTLSLLHLADRVSWLSLLRGPMCGLNLADLHALTGDNKADYAKTMLDLLHDAGHVSRLPPAGQKRVQALLGVLDCAFAEQDRRSLRAWVEGVWLALGGPICFQDDAAEEDAEVFFQLLQDLDDSGQIITHELIKAQIEKLCSQPDPLADECLQIMTIHKAKGLEFDTVIVPGLGKQSRGEDGKLLYWLETTDTDGQPELFFGPVKSAKDGVGSSTSRYIKNLEAKMRKLELGRLLYVAATRAKKRLHLFGHVTLTAKGEISHKSNSLLAQLWPAMGDLWVDALVNHDPKKLAEQAEPTIARRDFQYKIPSNWTCPEPPSGIPADIVDAVEVNEPIKFDWVGEEARAVGIVVHRYLQQLVENELTAVAGISGFEHSLGQMLLREGVSKELLGRAEDTVRTALENTIGDERGSWILSRQHENSRCELPLTAVVNGQIRHMIIDRTFIAKDGTRWIIDYKTGTHEGGDVEGFLDEEQKRYSSQLEAYATAFRKLEDRPIKTALYYPLIKDGWRVCEL